MTAQISAVVLAWDQQHLTEACVRSLRATADIDVEVIIVDNGSADDAAQYAAAASDVAVLNSRNEGFAAGMNAGLSRASAPFVAFVNNDTVLPPRWAADLLHSFSEHPRAGIIAPAVTHAANPRSVRSSPGVEIEVVDPFDQPPSAVVWVMATAVSRALGGFDTRYYPAAGEDLDLAFTVWSNDLDVLVDHRVLVQHVGKGTAAEKLPDWRHVWNRNAQLFLDRWSDPTDVPHLDDVDDVRFRRNLRTASAVARWMARYYQLRGRGRWWKVRLGRVVALLDRYRRRAGRWRTAS